MPSRKRTTGRASKAGCFLAIGGAEDHDGVAGSILHRFVELAGGKKARIVICGTPSRDPDAKTRDYRPAFEEAGAAEVIAAPIADRNEAEAPELLEGLDRATAVFFTGGDQLRLTSLIAGTSFGERVRERLWHEGLIVAGTSAGAAALGSVMTISGPSGGTVRRADVTLAPGLGFYWPDVLVDTHFSQRGRFARIAAVHAQNPQVLGVGIDENTALVLTPGEAFRVIGEGVVTVIDGRVTHTNAADVADEAPLALFGIAVHVLPAGYGFDVRTKQPLLPLPASEPA